VNTTPKIGAIEANRSIIDRQNKMAPRLKIFDILPVCDGVLAKWHVLK
jgi:hypothetical protein